MNLKKTRLVVHPEHDRYFGIGTGGTEPGEITIAIKDDLVEAALQVPGTPFLDATVAVGLRVRYRCPRIPGNE